MFSRRQLIAMGLTAAPYQAAQAGETHQATGVKVGEVTAHSATFWLRRTAASERLERGIVRRGHQQAAKYLEPETSPDILEGACPGSAGYMRVRWESGKNRGATPWREVDPGADFTLQQILTGLQPASECRYTVETRAARSRRLDGELTGRFRTLPAASAEARINVAMLSCQMYCHMDRADGFQIYESIQNSAPDFLLSCGDNVYYDNEDPIANTPAVARYHWQRMYSLSTLRNCLRNVGGFWQKDDHDTLVDDVWPTMRSGRMAPLSFIEGQRIFRQQVPAPPPDQPLYRRVRAGKNLEFFLTEARDYRSANTDADGPDKTIFGREQVEWLRKALAESDAQFKVVVNPNPMVGPDRVNKKDNHANQSFAAEGRALRKLLAQETPGIVVAVCGDRHWQFHSVDPESGLHEFCCGAASDEHAGGTPGHNPDLHRFHRVKGGYLWFSLEGAGRNASLTLTHRDVRGQALHTHKFSV